MKVVPIRDLNVCSVKGCKGKTTTIIQRTIGDEKMTYGYCDFHSVISATFFPANQERKVIPFAC